MQKERIIDYRNLLNNKYKMKNEYFSNVSLCRFIQDNFLLTNIINSNTQMINHLFFIV